MAMSEPLIIEIALNELVDRAENEHVPYSAEEVARDAVECVRAGAAIVHFHARDAVTGEQRWHDSSFYAEAVSLIRRDCDPIFYPTQPGSGLANCPQVLELADDPAVALELATVDILPPPYPGTADPMLEVLQQLHRRGVSVSIGVREIGHTRYIAKYHELGLLGDPLYVKIFLDDRRLVGPTPDVRAVLMYLDSLPRGVRCEWFTTVYGGDPESTTLRRMSLLAAAMGGHIRTGLGDNPRLDGASGFTNADHVRLAAEVARAAGREIASPAVARQILDIAPRRTA